jgi:hypothetical protein
LLDLPGLLVRQVFSVTLMCFDDFLAVADVKGSHVYMAWTVQSDQSGF